MTIPHIKIIIFKNITKNFSIEAEASITLCGRTGSFSAGVFSAADFDFVSLEYHAVNFQVKNVTLFRGCYSLTLTYSDNGICALPR